ncbi:MAG: DUF924 family protein [Parasphingopyxis sp.]|nr:DUF924 domain-containing protein [Sphingomonadales bacterium]
MNEADWPRAVLEFWFGEIGEQGWWAGSDATDAAIAERFGPLWEEQRDKPAGDFLATPERALAAVILFDQFSRNLFRGTAKAFATDALALEIAKGAIERGYDRDYSEAQRQFLYMPFMHSEKLADQERSLELFEALGDENSLKFAREHRDIIARFGRFPHRNEALGRDTPPAEKEAVEKGKDW